MTPRRRACTACMLLVLFVAVFCIKTLHHHHSHLYQSHTAASAAKHQVHDNCLLCMFMLSPFVESHEAVLNSTVSFTFFYYFTYTKQEIRTILYRILWRGPPSVC